ncbi:MAG: hypothetical protein LBR88_10525 [Zoogloeaceae bacterium]|jgi:hypothetical protein|nr:hypothetical protein [Zoogloeaceae bacterium]
MTQAAFSRLQSYADYLRALVGNMDEATWRNIAASQDWKVFEEYLSVFPEPAHARDARDRLIVLLRDAIAQAENFRREMEKRWEGLR